LIWFESDLVTGREKSCLFIDGNLGSVTTQVKMTEGRNIKSEQCQMPNKQ
jgi:hypothetical protein